MKLLLIATGDFFSSYGGGQVYVRNLADALCNLPLELVIVSISKKGTGVTEVAYNGSQVFSIQDARQLHEVIKDFKPNIIHAHSLKRETCSIGANLNIPVVITAHHGGILCPQGALLNRHDNICQAMLTHDECLPCVLNNIPGGRSFWYSLMKNIPHQKYIRLGRKLRHLPFMPFVTPVGIAADSINSKINEWNEIAFLTTRIIAPSQAIAKAMIRNGIDKSKISIIPHGIPVPHKIVRNQTLPTDILKFYFTGRIAYEKGLHVLIKAFIQIKAPAIELHIIGEAVTKKEKRYLRRLKEIAANDSRIIWHGKVAPEEIFNLTSQFHIGVSPSICLEVFGLNIAEALALGKPVIATRSGGGEMQITDGYNGWLGEPNDSKALLDTFNKIIENPEVIPEMSKNCKAISIEEHAKTLVTLYQEVIENYGKTS